MLGFVAAVIATESPSHDSPAEIHRTWMMSARQRTAPDRLHAYSPPQSSLSNFVSIHRPIWPLGLDRTNVQKAVPSRPAGRPGRSAADE